MTFQKLILLQKENNNPNSIYAPLVERRLLGEGKFQADLHLRDIDTVLRAFPNAYRYRKGLTDYLIFKGGNGILKLKKDFNPKDTAYLSVTVQVWKERNKATTLFYKFGLHNGASNGANTFDSINFNARTYGIYGPNRSGELCRFTLKPTRKPDRFQRAIAIALSEAPKNVTEVIVGELEDLTEATLTGDTHHTNLATASETYFALGKDGNVLEKNPNYTKNTAPDEVRYISRYSWSSGCTPDHLTFVFYEL